MSRGNLFIISGPSGSGKTTLHKKLLASKRLKGTLVKSISITTRPIRAGEKNGRDYLFVSLKKFLYKVKAGHFLEWQKVFENYYGTPKKNVEGLLRLGRNVLLCIDVKGAQVVAQQYPTAVRIFIKAPTFSLLKERLISRGSETQNDLKLRLETARKELLEAKKYDYIVINDDLTDAFKKLEAIIIQKIKKN